MIVKQGGHLTDSLDLSSLAKITDGYTPGHITTVAVQVLTERRIQQVHVCRCHCICKSLANYVQLMEVVPGKAEANLRDSCHKCVTYSCLDFI